MKKLIAMLLMLCGICHAQSTLPIYVPNQGWVGSKFTATASQIPTNGLVHYWAFTGLTGTNDLIGTDNVIGQTAIVATNGVKGVADTAWYYNGSSSFANLGDQTDLTFTTGTNGQDVAFSISAWIKCVVNNAQLSVFTKAVATTTTEYQFGVAAGPKPFHFIASTTANYLYNSASNNIPTNAWIHCVWTYDASKANAGMIMYTNASVVNYSVANSGTYTGMLNSTAPVYIGGRAVAGSLLPFRGPIDELRIYNRVLTPAEVSAIYNEEKP